MKRVIRKSSVFLLKWSLIAMGFMGIGMIYAGTILPSSVVYAEKEVIKEVEVKSIAPVMERIKQCESSGMQFGKDGQVLIHVNNNGSYDQGAYQINSIHNAQATKLGYNLATEEGNKGFAYWMYENLGTGDWYSSEKCWKK